MAKTRTVAMIAASASPASSGSVAIVLNISGTLPTNSCPPAILSGLNSPMKIVWLTPAAMNSEIPDPSPHLLITSSISMIITPPSISWKISTQGLIPASGCSPPIFTKTIPSKMTNAIASIFCTPWNLFLPSVVVRSNLTSPDPLSSCSTMDAVTIGPIPKLKIDPKLAPNIMDRYSNCAKEFSPNPNSGNSPSMKNMTSIRRVHFTFSLNPSFFCVGPFTSGRLLRILSSSPNFYIPLFVFFTV